MHLNFQQIPHKPTVGHTSISRRSADVWSFKRECRRNGLPSYALKANLLEHSHPEIDLDRRLEAFPILNDLFLGWNFERSQ